MKNFSPRSITSVRIWLKKYLVRFWLFISINGCNLLTQLKMLGFSRFSQSEKKFLATQKLNSYTSTREKLRDSSTDWSVSNNFCENKQCKKRLKVNRKSSSCWTLCNLILKEWTKWEQSCRTQRISSQTRNSTSGPNLHWLCATSSMIKSILPLVICQQLLTISRTPNKLSKWWAFSPRTRSNSKMLHMMKLRRPLNGYLIE